MESVAGPDGRSTSCPAVKRLLKRKMAPRGCSKRKVCIGELFGCFNSRSNAIKTVPGARQIIADFVPKALGQRDEEHGHAPGQSMPK